MIEKTVLDYLNSVLTVPVYMEVPEVPPTKFVVLEQTGSGRENLVNTATFAAQSYAGSLFDAAELNEDVKAAFDAITAQMEIGGVRLNSDYNFTDPTTKRYRYQCVYVLSYV